MNRPGLKGWILAVSRPNIERAETNETCCSRTMRTRVAKPGRLPHMGGVPRVDRIAAKCLSRSASVAAASARVWRVSVLAGFTVFPAGRQACFVPIKLLMLQSQAQKILEQYPAVA